MSGSHTDEKAVRETQGDVRHKETTDSSSGSDTPGYSEHGPGIDHLIPREEEIQSHPKVSPALEPLSHAV